MCNNSNELDSTYSRTLTEEYNISSKSYEAKHKKTKIINGHNCVSNSEDFPWQTIISIYIE